MHSLLLVAEMRVVWLLRGFAGCVGGVAMVLGHCEQGSFIFYKIDKESKLKGEAEFGIWSY